MAGGTTGPPAREPVCVRVKISDPDEPPPEVGDETDLRVLLPAEERFNPMADKLTNAGAHVRRVRYLLEDERIDAPAADRHHEGPVAAGRTCWLVRPYRHTPTPVANAAAGAAFDLMWQDHAPEAGPGTPPPAALVPAELAPLLPFRSLNPAQNEALPEIFGHEENLLVVAPTGAGKTVIGMAAALRSVVQQRRKSAWLVPQRALTDELDRELATWREHGLRVQRLSGEHSVDVARIRDADLWVATTEKFEAICRASAFREALAQVGTVVVDEIHMLGDPTRGAILEALLARVRDSDTLTRIIGLSATVSNAEEIATWLRARLVRVGWRPSRLTWQLPAIPRHADYAVTEANRIRLTSAITDMVTADDGSVLVFCGSKRNVRRTALVLASRRGVDVSGIRPDQPERLHEACRQARIGLHYQGWEHRQQAEQAFRRRDIDILVATSTVAAGVNLPARAVIVQDTQVGLNPLDVATVQQMFGRAGRVGAGEDQGWAFLIVEPQERADWQARLVAGHTVQSRIQSSLAEQVLSEVVQDRIGSMRQARQWWVRTLAYHQGRRDLRPLRGAIAFLAEAGMLTRTPDADAPGTSRLAATELGKLTTRLMVSPPVCDTIRKALADAPVPRNPDAAEELLIAVLAAEVPKLRQAGANTGAQPGDLARAALLAVTTTPEAFRAGTGQIGPLPFAAIHPVLEEAPRYLHWLRSQGLFGTVHPWCAVVAADLERRVRWRRLQPSRGAGRLLWICEQMATPQYMDEAVPALWYAARARGHRSPDWTSAGRPTHCHLDHVGYHALLRERATRAAVESRHGRVWARGPAGSVLTVWAGAQHQTIPIRHGEASVAQPETTMDSAGAVVFTWRGDYTATGWLTAYAQIPA